MVLPHDQTGQVPEVIEMVRGLRQGDLLSCAILCAVIDHPLTEEIAHLNAAGGALIKCYDDQHACGTVNSLIKFWNKAIEAGSFWPRDLNAQVIGDFHRGLGGGQQSTPAARTGLEPGRHQRAGTPARHGRLHPKGVTEGFGTIGQDSTEAHRHELGAMVNPPPVTELHAARAAST